MRIWQIFSNFLWLLHTIWLFCPKMSNLGHIYPSAVTFILYNDMDYPSGNFYTIWSSNINTTNIFHFFSIFAQNLAILPQKREVTHFPEVYQTFSYFWNIIETNHSSRLLSSENSHDSQILRSKTRRRATPLLPTWTYSCWSRVTVSCALPFMINVTISTSISQTFRFWVAKFHLRQPMVFLISQLIRYVRACSSYEWFIPRAAGLSSRFHGQGYVMERLKSSLGKFYLRYGDLIKYYEVSLSQMLHDIQGHDHIQWHPQLIRHNTNLRTWLYYRILEVSIEYCNGCG